MFWAHLIQSTLPQPISLRSVLISSFHLRLGLSSCLFWHSYQNLVHSPLQTASQHSTKSSLSEPQNLRSHKSEWRLKVLLRWEKVRKKQTDLVPLAGVDKMWHAVRKQAELASAAVGGLLVSAVKQQMMRAGRDMWLILFVAYIKGIISLNIDMSVTAHERCEDFQVNFRFSVR
jgi:hypothetical protein